MSRKKIFFETYSVIMYTGWKRDESSLYFSGPIFILKSEGVELELD